MQRFRPLRILVVEDNPDDVEITRRAFKQSSAPNELVVARDGRAVLDLLFGSGSDGTGGPPLRPDLVLLDINLPKVNGFEVLEQIRADDAVSMIPVVMLTASVREEDVIRSYGLGANSYIQKPLVFESFLRVLGVLGEYWFEVVTLPRAVS